MDTIIFTLEIVGTIAFSVSGAMIAIKKEMDLFGVLFLGLVTSFAGGVMRDCLLGICPAKIFINPLYPIISVMTSVVVFIICLNVSFEKNLPFFDIILLVIDSIGLGVFTVVGIRVTQNIYGVMPILNIFMGVLTGVGGGVLRDVFSCELPNIFVRHFYAMASIIGAIFYVVLSELAGVYVAVIAGMLTIILLRLLAAHYRWKLPKCRESDKDTKEFRFTYK